MHNTLLATPLEISITDSVSILQIAFVTFLFLQKPFPHPQEIPIPSLRVGGGRIIIFMEQHNAANNSCIIEEMTFIYLLLITCLCAKRVYMYM